MAREQSTLTDLARLGFGDLNHTVTLLAEIRQLTAHESSAANSWWSLSELLPCFGSAADPDQALRALATLLRRHPGQTSILLHDADAALRLIRVLGASQGLADFFIRRPDDMLILAEPLLRPHSEGEYRRFLLEAVALMDPTDEEESWNDLRACYRRHLTQLAAWDLSQEHPLEGLDSVTSALADLAAAALDASLVIAQNSVQSGRMAFTADEVAGTRLAIIGMGKAGARELNYVSDVDVIFVAEGLDGLSDSRAVEVGTRLAMATMRGIHDFAVEPALWEVDANLRPEGKDGALVRTLDSHLVYYQRWARSWEFQALLKARPLAGDTELGLRYVDSVAPMVWTSASRINFVEGVQRMRERVTDNIPSAELEYQLKLGPGGLRDVEFTIQLLQLVHGQSDDLVRQRATLPALTALAEQGYIGRVEAAEFSRDYRFLRLLEHRLQLAQLRRTHLMPNDREALRILARATGLASSAADLIDQWTTIKRAVRSLHERLFYRPLLSAVAALPDGGLVLSSQQAVARLAAIGFTDPKGALAHIAALTGGVSRRSSIQSHLLPVMLEWFSDGADPDYGLLAFRRLSDDLGESYWFLRMLRDSSGAAKRLTTVLSGSRFVGVLLERIPEAAAWFDRRDELTPRTLAALLDETASTLRRHPTAAAACLALRTARRREVLRLAIGAILGSITVEQLGQALSDVTTALLTGVLHAVRFSESAAGQVPLEANTAPKQPSDGIEFAIVAMGRYGGQELGFGSDIDLMYVYRARTATAPEAQARAEFLVNEIKRHTEDLRLPLDLDIDLRPEGRNGAVARSLDSYRAYYERWSLTWEAQALLRARAAIGDADLLSAFECLADEVRFPLAIAENDVREVKRIKARMESERLPQAADPARHLKLGRGSLSDVEWFVQLIQLQHGARISGLRTTSTLIALEVARKAGFLADDEAQKLHDAWILASRARSAITLWMARTNDVLPTERQQLEGIARLLEYPPGSASMLEEDYLRVTRLARAVFEKRFYGEVPPTGPSTG